MAKVEAIHALTGVRALAAMWVALVHLTPYTLGLFPEAAPLMPFFYNGNLGVDLFFILSGFILAHNYLDAFARPSLKACGEFLWMRLSRIYPVHGFTLLGLLGLLAASSALGFQINNPQQFSPQGFFANVFLVSAWTWGPSDGPSWNYPAWSISAEWLAYLIFPAVAMGMAPVRSVVPCLIGMAGLWGMMLWAFSTIDYSDLYIVNAGASLRVTTEFISGCFLYQIYRSGVGRRLPTAELTLVSLIAILVLGFTLPFGVSLAMVPLLALFIFALAHEQGRFARWLATPGMIFWGQVSFSLYMTHAIVIMVVQKVLAVSRFAGSPLWLKLAVFAFVLALIGAVATGVYMAVERPAQRAMRRLPERIGLRAAGQVAAPTR